MASFNTFVERYNAKHQPEIDAGTREPLQGSSVAFIEKASGIKARYVHTKEGILDIDRMCPKIAERNEEEISHQAEIAVAAARNAMAAAGKTAADIDAVIVSCA